MSHTDAYSELVKRLLEWGSYPREPNPIKRDLLREAADAIVALSETPAQAVRIQNLGGTAAWLLINEERTYIAPGESYAVPSPTNEEENNGPK